MTSRAKRIRRGTERTLRIGLTGPIGCGKSTVAGWLREAGATVIDADQLARAVVEPGEPALAEVVAAFGAHVVRSDGTLDRAALGHVVFADRGALALLESIIHPAVRPRILAAMVAAELDRAPAVVVEAIKLVEGGLAELCDEVWLVTCDPAAQRERLRGRGGDPAYDAARVDAQADLVDRLAPAATRLVDTNETIPRTRREVLAAYAAALAARPGA